MIDLDDFLPEINPKAPGVPAPAAYKAILQACDELCTRTLKWKYSDTVPVIDLDDIEFFPPDQTVLVDFESILWNDEPLTPKTTAWMDQCMCGWRRGAIVGAPRYFSQITPNSFRVAPIENGLLTVNAFLKPSMDADQVADFLYVDHHELVAWGALGRLLVTPDQPFTDPATGAMYLARFAQKLDSIAFTGFTGQQRAPLRTRGQYM